MMMIHPSLHEPLVVTFPAPHHDQLQTGNSLSFILSDLIRKQWQSDRVTHIKTLKIAKLPLLQLIAVRCERANWPLLTVYVRTRRDKSHKAGSAHLSALATRHLTRARRARAFRQLDFASQPCQLRQKTDGQIICRAIALPGGRSKEIRQYILAIKPQLQKNPKHIFPLSIP